MIMIASFANKTTHAHIFGKASCTNHHLRKVAEHVVTISCQPKVPGIIPGLGKIMDFEANSKKGKKSSTTSADSELANDSITRLAMGKSHRSYRRCADHACCEFNARVGPSSSCAPAFNAPPIDRLPAPKRATWRKRATEPSEKSAHGELSTW